VQGPGRLTNAEGETMEGFGQIEAPFTNAGTLLLDSGFTISNTVGSFENPGTIIIRGDFSNSGLFLTNGFTNEGVIEFTTTDTTFGAERRLQVENGTLVNVGTIRSVLGDGIGDDEVRTIAATLDNQGTLQGVLTVEGELTNSGTVIPGFSPGTIAVSGGYTQTAAGTLDFEMSGAGSTASDLLAVSGAATLDGTLNVAFVDDCSPIEGDEFVVVTHTASIGTFSDVNTTLEGSPTAPSAAASSTQTETTIQISAPTAVTLTTLSATALPSLSRWTWAIFGLATLGVALRVRQMKRLSGAHHRTIFLPRNE
jgi:hypothetical protein